MAKGSGKTPGDPVSVEVHTSPTHRATVMTTMPESLAGLVPALESDWPSTLQARHVEQILIRSIHAKRLEPVCRAILALDPESISEDSRMIAGHAASTCAAVAALSLSEQKEYLRILQKAGISATSANDSQSLQQYLNFVIRVPPTEVSRAITVFECNGFVRWGPPSAGAWRSFRQTHHEVSMIRTDSATTRVAIRWRDPTSAAPWGRLFRPGNPEYRLLNLPQALWPVYHMIRPLRSVTERLFRRRLNKHLGGFLGTPTSLIEPLLDMAGVKAADHLVDLGCGDGRVLVEAVRTRGCRATGLELDASLIQLARKKIEAEGLADRIEIRAEDVNSGIPADASVVFLFLPVAKVGALLDRISRDVKPGTRVLFHEQDPINPGLKPDESRPIFSDSAVTVAHLCKVPSVSG